MNKNASFLADVLRDTTIVSGDTTIVNKCYYNCAQYIPPDSIRAIVEGNVELPSASSTIAQGTRLPNVTGSIRTDSSGVYTYDFLSPQAEQYLDSIAFTPCVQALYRGTLNGKYIYWYDNQAVPAGVTNIVKIK